MYIIIIIISFEFTSLKRLVLYITNYSLISILTTPDIWLLKPSMLLTYCHMSPNYNKLQKKNNNNHKWRKIHVHVYQIADFFY